MQQTNDKPPATGGVELEVYVLLTHRWSGLAQIPSHTLCAFSVCDATSAEQSINRLYPHISQKVNTHRSQHPTVERLVQTPFSIAFISTQVCVLPHTLTRTCTRCSRTLSGADVGVRVKM